MAISNETLFELPMAETGGRVVVTRPQDKVYLISFSSGADNRLLTSFCQTLIRALDILLYSDTYPPGVVITTSSISKFYSNGLDLVHANTVPGFWKKSLYALFLRLITYPMPTVALINGHAFAGGFMVAMMHDYRCMNPHKGFLCLNELELGVPLKAAMLNVFKEKMSPSTLRSMVLEAHRYKALDALKEGVVDWLGGLPEVLAHIEEFKLVQKAQEGMSGLPVYGQLKQEMYRDTIDFLERTTEEDIRYSGKLLQWAQDKKERQEMVKAWERTRAKLYVGLFPPCDVSIWYADTEQMIELL